MFKDIHKIHFIGAGGIGVSAIIRFFLKLGKEVSGSDAVESENVAALRNSDAKIFIGHNETNLSNDTDLVVYSSAVPFDNPELKKAEQLNIASKSYSEMLGEIMKNYSCGIAVSGTNGKTTTTSLLGLMLEKDGLDPTVVVGGKINSPNKEWDGNLRFGKNQKYFVAEACEYRKNMLNLNPKIITLTNIEEDHLDYFKNLDDIKSAFVEYILRLSQDGALIYNQDDAASKEAAEFCKVKKLSYSLDGKQNSDPAFRKASLEAKNILEESGMQSFDLIWQGKNLGRCEIFLPGIFNIYNSLAAALSALCLGVSYEIVKKTLAEFNGTWRRFEKVGILDHALVISDYAHHPTAIRETISGAKKFYPGKKILVAFEPHQKDRTLKLFNEFVGSFNEADEVIISEIYSVEGRNDAEREISSLDLVDAIKNKSPLLFVSYSPNLIETKKMILEKAKNFDIILIMGAGDIYKVANEVARETRP